jgi:hypothetical protein
MKPDVQDTAAQAAESLESTRRAFLKNAGKIAVYTPPAMLALAAPTFSAIAQSSGGSDQRDETGSGRRKPKKPKK